MRSIRKAALGAAAAMLLAGTAACGSDSDSAEGTNDDDSSQSDTSARSAFDAVQAAADSTQEITSADFEGLVEMPESAGGSMEMSGSMAWGDEIAMSMVMAVPAVDPSQPSEMTMLWVDDTIYMDMGEENASEYDGRHWFAMDLGALQEEAAGQGMEFPLTDIVSEANQDPSQQLALLLQSPEIEFVAEEEIDGATASRYAGTISIEDAMEENADAAMLTEEEREQLVEAMNQQGIESYDIDVWVNEDDYPVQIRQSFDSNEGPVTVLMTYSNYGTEVNVEPPPADAVVSFQDMINEMQGDL